MAVHFGRTRSMFWTVQASPQRDEVPR